MHIMRMRSERLNGLLNDIWTLLKVASTTSAFDYIIDDDIKLAVLTLQKIMQVTARTV